jgi:hypothetical protein
MSRRSHSTKNFDAAPRLNRLTSTALVLGLAVSWSMPSLALAGPPELPPEPSAVTEPAPAPAPAPEPVVVQPAPAPAPEPAPAPQPGWEQPQTQPTAQPQPVPPPPVYQPPPQPVPPPYKPYNKNRGLGLTIAGFSIFGFSYLITAVSGTIAIDAGSPEIGRPLLIPAVGPFIAASRVPSATLGFGLGFTGVIQLAGLGMGIGGAVMLGNSRRQAALSAAPGGLQLQF